MAWGPPMWKERAWHDPSEAEKVAAATADGLGQGKRQTFHGTVFQVRAQSREGPGRLGKQARER